MERPRSSPPLLHARDADGLGDLIWRDACVQTHHGQSRAFTNELPWGAFRIKFLAHACFLPGRATESLNP